ncbi:MAG: hypothetical protein PUC66_07170 [Erysipelotrichaceae bacterium]|nr:hypothetical protein [Erysipelotrichaceae bacterium]
MSLEEYKKKVEECLVKDENLSDEEAKSLIKESESEFPWFFKRDCTPRQMAGILTSPLW